MGLAPSPRGRAPGEGGRANPGKVGRTLCHSFSFRMASSTAFESSAGLTSEFL
jgi:hypothetical protein